MVTRDKRRIRGGNDMKLVQGGYQRPAGALAECDGSVEREGDQ